MEIKTTSNIPINKITVALESYRGVQGCCRLITSNYFQIQIIQRSKYVPQWYVQDYKSLFAVMPEGHWVFNLITIGLRQLFTGSHLRQSYGRIILNLISHRPASAL